MNRLNIYQDIHALLGNGYFKLKDFYVYDLVGDGADTTYHISMILDFNNKYLKAKIYIDKVSLELIDTIKPPCKVPLLNKQLHAIIFNKQAYDKVNYDDVMLKTITFLEIIR